MSYGFRDNILRIDLTTGTVSTEHPGEAFFKKFLGGKTLAGWYLNKEVSGDCDALSPDNKIVVAASVVTGSPIPGSSRFTVSAKSPLTDGFGDSEAGGFFGPELKFAGYDAIIIEGKAENPCYIFIKDDTVEISNLNRQILHSEKFLNDPKTDSVKEIIHNFNSDIELITYHRRFDANLAEKIVKDYDVIVDCIDNYATRKISNTYAGQYNRPLIEAGIERLSGFVQIVIPGETACFNCFELEEKEIYRQVLGASTGVIGSLQALECIKLLTGLWDRSYSYIAINFENYVLDRIFLEANEHCICTNKKSV